MKSLLIKTTLVVLSLVFIGFMVQGKVVNQSVVYGENAQILGEVLDIRAVDEGPISKMNIRKGQYVTNGAPLFSIDASMLETSIRQSLSLTKAKIKKWNAKCNNKNILKLAEQSAKERFSDETRRFNISKKLYQDKFLSEEDYQQSLSSLRIAELNLSIKRAEYQNQLADVSISVLKEPEISYELEKLKELVYRKSTLSVRSPVHGYVSDVKQFEGAWVSKEEAILTLISQDEVYVAANVLEKKIKHISPDLAAEVVLDIYGEDVVLPAKVKAVTPATMSTFSMIPQNNVNSNWIKVSQRVPVLLEILDIKSATKGLHIPIGGNARIKIFTDNKLKPAQLNDSQSMPATQATAGDDWLKEYTELIESDVKTFMAQLKMNQSC